MKYKIKQVKQNYWEKFSKDMEHDLYARQKEMWTFLRNRKKPRNEYLHIASINPQEWTTYFRKVYDNKDNDLDNEPMVGTKEEITVIPIEVIQDAIIKLKNRKAPGTDNISN